MVSIGFLTFSSIYIEGVFPLLPSFTCFNIYIETQKQSYLSFFKAQLNSDPPHILLLLSLFPVVLTVLSSALYSAMNCDSSTGQMVGLWFRWWGKGLGLPLFMTLSSTARVFIFCLFGREVLRLSHSYSHRTALNS